MQLLLCFYSLGVEHIYLLEPVMRTGGPIRYYLTRPEITPMQYIASHIKSDVKIKEQRQYTILFIPRVLALCEYVLEREGVIGHIKRYSWNLNFIPLDDTLLSLEHPNTARTLFLEGNYSILHLIATSLIDLEEKCGTIPTIHGKGKFSEMVYEMFVRIKEVRGINEFHLPRSGATSVSEVILFDRSCDWVTPMCSQLTYEGMLDDVFGIQSGFLEFSKETSGKGVPVKVLLNEEDPVFSIIRSMHFSGVSEVLINISQELKRDYDHGRDRNKTIQEMKEFVKCLPQLRSKHDSLSTHLKASESIIRKKKEGDFQRQLTTEWILLEGSDKAKAYEHIEESIEGQSNIYASLQFLCLSSTTSDGIKDKYYQPFKTSFFHSYGHKHLVTFDHLEKVGLLKSKKVREDLPTRSLAKDESASFFQLQRLLKLVPKRPETYNMKEPTDASYVFGGAYVPLSCAAFANVVMNGGWHGITDVIRNWEGVCFTKHQNRSQRKERLPEKRIVLVYFIGGCSYSEVNALRFLSTKLNVQFVVATTDIVNWKKLLDSFMEFEVNV